MISPKSFMRTACVLASLSLLAPLPFAFAADSEDMKIEHVIETVGTVDIDWSEGVVRVTGTGTPPDRGPLPQKRMMAERTATTNAYRELARAIDGIRVNSETLVRDYTSESSSTKTYVNALIKGAQKLDQRYLDDGTIEIDMAIKLYSTTGLSGVLQPQKHIVPPPPVTVEAKADPGDYTGVIVDCRGLGLSPAMSPAIVSQGGGEVYVGNHEIKPEFVINQGIVGYARSLSQARQDRRIGDKPLIIKGLNATGNFHTDVVISENDTKHLLGLDKAQDVLKGSKVIFVM
jgi:hypothetical protein